MKETMIIFKRDFIEMRRTNAFLILNSIFAILTVSIAIAVSILFKRQAWIMLPAARPLLIMILGLIAYFLSFSVFMAYIWVFASLPIVKEKVNGTIISLLAAALRPGQVWLAKSLAIFLPSFLLSTLSTVIVLTAINLLAIRPAAGIFILPAPLTRHACLSMKQNHCFTSLE